MIYSVDRNGGRHRWQATTHCVTVSPLENPFNPCPIFARSVAQLELLPNETSAYLSPLVNKTLEIRVKDFDILTATEEEKRFLFIL